MQPAGTPIRVTGNPKEGKVMRLTSIVVIAALASGICAQTQAQTPGESRREERRASPAEQACKTEIQQLCQGQKGQQAEQCLRNNQAKLSSQCKAALPTPQK
jgi:hypothetical protein